MKHSRVVGTLTALATAVLSLTAAAPRAPQAVAAPPPGRPNIVWISNEDMSPHLGAYGDALARTPVLDRFARESVRFTHAFTTAPVCAPSRAAIITGMYQTAIGAQHMRTTEDRVPELPGPYLAVPPFYVKAFPEYLRAAGYYTTNRAKTDYQFGVPFTIWDDLGRNAHWRNRPDRNQPFFAVFNLEVTHESQIFPSSPARKGKPLVTDPAKVAVPPYYPDTPAVREELARMYDNIADMDSQVGEILRQLEEDRLAETTIVFYWSDHGDGVPRSKRSLYDSGLRVPLMIRWPKSLASPVVPGSVSDRLVSFVDLAPTVLALAGVEVPAHLQGRVLIGPKAAPAPEFVFGARDRMDIEYDMMRSARDARFLYIRNFAPELPYAGHIIYRNQSAIMQDWLRLQANGTLTGPAALWMRTHRPAEELYDTTTDPYQVRDLSADPAHRATLERMRTAVTDWMTRVNDQGLVNEPEMIQRMWPGGVQPETAQPYIVSRRETDAPSRRASMTIDGPTEVVIYVPTQGASIGYSTEDGPAARWRLYTGPILVHSGMTLRAKAIRYGYKESAETRVLFTQSQSQPNIVFIYADDLGYGDVSSYGATAVQTPNIDRVAAEGLRFTDAHSPAATCTPSRYALLTGEYAFRRAGTGVLPGDAALIIEPGRTTLPGVLKKAGYVTGVVGKWHLGLGPKGGPDWNAEIKPSPNDIGFDSSFIMAATGDRVPTVYIENRRVVGLDPADPIRVSYAQPIAGEPTGKTHPELLTTQRPSHGHDQAIVNGVSRIGYMTGGKTALWKDEDMADVFTNKAVAFIEQRRSSPFFLYFALHDPHVPRVPHPRFVGRTKLGPRGDAIAQLDWSVGQVLDALDRLSLSNNTIVIVTSDNGPVVDDGYQDDAEAKLGPHRPSGPFRGGKYSTFEAGTRVPLVIRWPQRVKPGVSAALVSQIDLLRSVAALTKQTLAPGDAPDSLDTMGAFVGTDTTGRRELVEQAGGLALRLGRWKYIEPNTRPKLNAQTRTELGNDPAPQLYDLAEDPAETRNIAPHHPSRVKEMQTLLQTIVAASQVSALKR